MRPWRMGGSNVALRFWVLPPKVDTTMSFRWRILPVATSGVELTDEAVICLPNPRLINPLSVLRFPSHLT